MEGRKLVVVEANEIPRRVVEDLAPTGRIPFLADVLEDGGLIETVADEPAPRELYPSQTWASINTGVGYAQHGIYWYGDPKPERFPLYWQHAARSGRSVGLVNTLHSSPVATQCADGDFRFVLPDCFSADPQAIPADLTPFQRANTALTAANRRKVGLMRAPVELAAVARSLPKLGLRPWTVADLARLIGGAATGRIPRERLRSGQFLLTGDLFRRLLDEETPDLGVVFTNHVAAAMHRYWYAMYPGDFCEDHYGQDWVDRYRNEIASAMAGLDRFLMGLHQWCQRNDRTLILLSSMGQGPSDRLEADAGLEAVIIEPRRFLDSLGIDQEVQILGSMVPQLTLECRTAALASRVASILADVEAGEVFWDVDGTDSVVTLTYHLDPVSIDSVRLGGVRRSADSVGVAVYEVDDHSSGRHIAEGIVAVSNSPSFKPPEDPVVSALDVAPAILGHLGLQPLDHHQEPVLQL